MTKPIWVVDLFKCCKIMAGFIVKLNLVLKFSYFVKVNLSLLNKKHKKRIQKSHCNY